MPHEEVMEWSRHGEPTTSCRGRSRRNPRPYGSVIWRRTALGDLEAIREFIAQDNPHAATRVHAARPVLPSTPSPPIRTSAGPGAFDGTRELIVVDLPYICRLPPTRRRRCASSPSSHAARQWTAALPGYPIRHSRQCRLFCCPPAGG